MCQINVPVLEMAEVFTVWCHICMGSYPVSGTQPYCSSFTMGGFIHRSASAHFLDGWPDLGLHHAFFFFLEKYFYLVCETEFYIVLCFSQRKIDHIKEKIYCEN